MELLHGKINIWDWIMCAACFQTVQMLTCSVPNSFRNRGELDALTAYDIPIECTKA